MGTDRSVGLTRIKEQGGVTILQAADDAEHEDMPRAAAATGVVDFILPVVDIPQMLIDMWSNASQIKLPPFEHIGGETASDSSPESNDEAALARILTVLCSRTGHEFKHYKRTTVLRRIERRMQVCAVATLPDYLKRLEEDLQESTALGL